MDDGILLPPHSIEAEQSVLGSLLLDARAFEHIGWLTQRDFYSSQHRAIYGAIVGLIESGIDPDPILVCERLRAGEFLEIAGGIPYVGALAHSMPSAANALQYAKIVQSRSRLRQLIGYSAEIGAAAHDPGANAEAVADAAENKLTAIFVREAERDPVDFKTACFRAVDWLESDHQGLGTGLRDLDPITGGLKPGELILLAGRPSMGKSALAQQIAEHVGQQDSVAYFSLEMSARQIGVRGFRWHRERIGSDEALRHAAGLKLIIDDTPAVTLAHIRIRCRRIRRKSGLGLIVIDYLQLMRAPRTENRLQEIGEISRGLKSLAKEFDVPVIGVAQLSRAPTGRTDKRPELSDLRESGQLEQDADIVIMLYRDHPDFCEALVRKNRDGATGMIGLRWNGPLTRFTDWAGPYPQAIEQLQRSYSHRDAG